MNKKQSNAHHYSPASINHYAALNLPSFSSIPAVETAYKALVKESHPDLFPPEERLKEEERFKRITVAHYILSESKRKLAYDKELTDVLEAVQQRISAYQNEHWRFPEEQATDEETTVNHVETLEEERERLKRERGEVLNLAQELQPLTDNAPVRASNQECHSESDTGSNPPVDAPLLKLTPLKEVHSEEKLPWFKRSRKLGAETRLPNPVYLELWEAALGCEKAYEINGLNYRLQITPEMASHPFAKASIEGHETFFRIHLVVPLHLSDAERSGYEWIRNLKTHS